MYEVAPYQRDYPIHICTDIRGWLLLRLCCALFSEMVISITQYLLETSSEAISKRGRKRCLY